MQHLTFDVVGGLIRHALTVAGGAFATSGLIDASNVETIVGALMVIIGTIWSVGKKLNARNPDA